MYRGEGVKNTENLEIKLELQNLRDDFEELFKTRSLETTSGLFQDSVSSAEFSEILKKTLSVLARFEDILGDDIKQLSEEEVRQIKYITDKTQNHIIPSMKTSQIKFKETLVKMLELSEPNPKIGFINRLDSDNEIKTSSKRSSQEIDIEEVIRAIETNERTIKILEDLVNRYKLYYLEFLKPEK